MKNISILFFLLVFVFSCGKKELKKESKENKELVIEKPITKVDETKNEEVKEVSSKLVFTVQIAALRNSNDRLASLPNVNLYQEDLLTKYRLGSFDTYKEAKMYRKQVIKNYKGAFVQALRNNKPITISEANNL